MKNITYKMAFFFGYFTVLHDIPNKYKGDFFVLEKPVDWFALEFQLTGFYMIVALALDGLVTSILEVTMHKYLLLGFI